MKALLVLFLVVGPVSGASRTWTGQITDSMCGTNHAAMSPGAKTVNAHDCTLACAKAGSKYAFVSNGKVFRIANQSLADIAKQAGMTVALTGDLGADGQTITVSGIVPKK